MALRQCVQPDVVHNHNMDVLGLQEKAVLQRSMLHTKSRPLPAVGFLYGSVLNGRKILIHNLSNFLGIFYSFHYGARS